jgi:hypothetical protein
MNVLIIPEHPSKDQYILKPLFTRLFQQIGARNTRVEVCQDPVLGNVDEALKSERLLEIVEKRQAMTDIFILCVDRDGQAGRRQRLAQIENEFENGPKFFTENAWEEVETWVLAGLDLPGTWRWQNVRAEVNVKEQYFEPLAAQRGLTNAPGGGRRTLGEEASRNISAIRLKCPEDFDALARRLEATIAHA